MNAPEIDNYVIKEVVGEGATGRVFAAETPERPGIPLAVKVILPRAVNRQFLFDALSKILNHPQHPLLNPVLDFDLTGPTPYLSSPLQADRIRLDNGNEYWQPRTLDSLCGGLDRADAWFHLGGIADALAHLHRLRVSHCGLTTTNILLADEDNGHGRVRLTDFSQGIVAGVSTIYPGDSAAFAAPEQLRDTAKMADGASERWDVYAFGVVAFRLLTGQFPRLSGFIDELRRRRAANPATPVKFDFKSLAAALEKQAAIQWPVPAVDSDEESTRALVESCLAVDPDLRPCDMREVLDRIARINAGTAADSAPGLPSTHPRGLSSSTAGGFRRPETAPLSSLPLPFLVLAGLAALLALLFGIFALRQGGAGALARALTFRGPESNSGHAEAALSEMEDVPPPAPDPAQYVPIAEAEVLKSRAEAAIEDLRISGESVDEVFNALVERDATGEAIYSVPEGALGSLLSYYEDFADQHGQAPTLGMEVARAYNNAGEIKIALGDPTQAIDNYGKAIDKLEELRVAAPDDGRVLYNLAFYLQNLAVAQKMARLPNAALSTAQKATDLFQILDERNGSPASKRSLVQSYLQLGEAMTDLGQTGNAGIVLDKAATLVDALETTNGQSESDIATLSRIDFERARIEKLDGNRKDSIDLLIASADRLIDPLLKAQPESAIHRFRLAECYAELSDLVAADGSADDAREANDQAIGLLVELTEEAPDKTRYRHRLAKRFVALAQLERDGGKNATAIDATKKAISLLADLVTHTPEKARYTYDLALTRGLAADLYREGSKKTEALEAAGTAVNEITDLLKDDFDPENADAKRPEYRKAQAELCGKFGGHLEAAGRKPEARVQYDKAFRQWELLAQDPKWADDPLVKDGLAKMKAKMDKIPAP